MMPLVCDCSRCFLPAELPAVWGKDADVFLCCECLDLLDICPDVFFHYGWKKEGSTE